MPVLFLERSLFPVHAWNKATEKRKTAVNITVFPVNILYLIFISIFNKKMIDLFWNINDVTCQEDVYLKELVCYIHLHPVKFSGGNPII